MDETPSYLATAQPKPIVYKAGLEIPGSEGILRNTDAVVPQYSGMSFIQFDYPPGEYTGKSFDCWLIGIVRKPYENRFCEFGETRTRARKICAGEIIVIEPGADYSTKISTQGQVDYLVLSEDRFKQAVQAQHHDSVGECRSGATYFNSPLILPLVDAIMTSANRPDTFDPYHADNFINAAVSGLCRPLPDLGSVRGGFHNGLSARDLRMLDDYIDNAAEAPVTNACLAALLNLPEAVLQKAFKAATGETPYQYVIQRRIERARTMLGTTQASLAEIAYACGFASQSHMSEVFRCRVGASPGKVRKSLRGH